MNPYGVRATVLVGIWAAEIVDNFRMGAHWPIYQVASLFVAACLLIVV